MQLFLFTIPLLATAIKSDVASPTNHLRARMLQQQPPVGGGGGGGGGAGRTTVCSTTVAPSFGTVTPGKCLALTSGVVTPYPSVSVKTSEQANEQKTADSVFCM
jgi:hypothetical protein